MNEAYLKKRLVESAYESLPGCVVFRHEDKFTAGIPDISITWAGRTAWVEVKYERPGRKSDALPTAIQEQTLRRLRRAMAVSLLVTFRDSGQVSNRKTDIDAGSTAGPISSPGFDYRWTIETIELYLLNTHPAAPPGTVLVPADSLAGLANKEF